MNFETNNYSVNYPKQEANSYKKDVVKNGIEASKLMDYEK